MFDPNQVTAQLAKLPDQALQQFAAMHKADPYTLSLAVAESNRRKQMRAGGAMQQGPQGPVVDQAIAGMNQNVPEVPQTPSYLQGLAQQPQVQQPQQQQAAGPNMQNAGSGIAQLPSGNMNMAGGGLVAFADGGDVQHYQTGGTARAYGARARENIIGDVSQYAEPAFYAGQTAARGWTENIFPFLGGLVLGPAGEEIPVSVAPGVTKPAATTTTPLFKDGKMVQPAGIDSTRIGASVSSAGPAIPAGGIGSLTGGDTGLFDYAKKIGEEDRAAIEAAIAARKKSGEPFEGLEALLTKQREGDVKDLEHAKGVALLRAGATLASTPGDFLEAAGKAVQPALTEYEATRRDIDKGADARDMQEMALKEARRAKKEGDVDKELAWTMQAKQAERAANMAGYTVAAQERALNARMASMERIANIRNTAAMTLAEARAAGQTDRWRQSTLTRLIIAGKEASAMQLDELVRARDEAPPNSKEREAAEKNIAALQNQIALDAKDTLRDIEAGASDYGYQGVVGAASGASAEPYSLAKYGINVGG